MDGLNFNRITENPLLPSINEPRHDQNLEHVLDMSDSWAGWSKHHTHARLFSPVKLMTPAEYEAAKKAERRK